MKLEKLVGERFKERPSDCVIDSHAFFIRGGYMKGVANGIYSSYLPLRRITRKIEQIIREEMRRRKVAQKIAVEQERKERERYLALCGEYRDLCHFLATSKPDTVEGITPEYAAAIHRVQALEYQLDGEVTSWNG